MINTMAAFGIAVGGASLVCYLLMTRVQNRRAVAGRPATAPGRMATAGTGGAFPTGLAATILDSIVRAIRLTPAAATVGEATPAEEATAVVEAGVVEAINDAHMPTSSGICDLPQ